MKLSKIVFFVGITATALFLNGCSEDVVSDPITTVLGKDCTIEKATTGKNSFSYTYESGKLMSVVDKIESGTTTYNLVYESGKLAQLTTLSTNYVLTYTGNNVTLVEEKDAKSGVVNYDYTIAYDANNKLKKVTTTSIDQGKRTLEEEFTYTFNGDNLSQMLNSIDTDDDGVLDTQYDVTFRFTSYDAKINPFYNLPMYWVDLSNPQYLSKNNMLTAEYEVLSEKTSIVSTFNYNTSDYPTQISTRKGAGAAQVTDITYNCK